jgi:hypothetical protein
LKTKEDLTPEEVRELEIKFRGWGLEGGDFFDGARFRDMMGGFYPNHPSKNPIKIL